MQSLLGFLQKSVGNADAEGAASAPGAPAGRLILIALGFLAVAGLIVETNRRGLAPRRLALRNSGDTAGGRERVVGYGAWTVEEMAAH